MPWHKQLLWLPEYSVGHPLLDAQHKKLQWLCHAAAYYLGNHFDDEAERYKDILHDLGVYAQQHFSTEEALLERIGYPGLAAHQAEHQAYLAKLSMAIAEMLGGQLYPQELAEWLSDWWLHHTLGADSEYSSFL